MNGWSWTPEKFGNHQVGTLDFSFVCLYKMLLVSLFVCEFGDGIACYFPYSRFKIVAYLICHNLAVSEVVVNLQYSHTND